MEPKIIYEDEEILVLDKPAGWIVNDAKTTGETPTVQHWLEKNIKSPISNNKEYRSGIVHRLDKETSGILLVAKTPESFGELQRQFKERIVKKTYLVLVHGNVKPGEGEVKAPIGRLGWSKERFGVTLEGREALTKYKKIKDYQNVGQLFSLLEVYPQTGRTHQIRVHLQYLGYPIVADEFYAGRKTARDDRTWCPRVFLHAAKISFLHPHTKKIKELESSLPEELKRVLVIFKQA